MIFPERAFLYGDLLFETMLASGLTVPHASRHFRRLMHSAELLKMDTASLNESVFLNSIESALRNSGVSDDDNIRRRVRFELHRNAPGYYLPVHHQTTWSVRVDPLPEHPTEKFVKLGVYTDQSKAPGWMSNLKSGNALLYVMASVWAKEKGFDDACILNTNGEIIETTHSNLFWKSGDRWFTPPLASGCVSGISREIFLEENPVMEKACFINDLGSASEIILTNALYLRRNAQLIIE